MIRKIDLTNKNYLSRIISFFLIAMVGGLFLILFYWAKCQERINLFKNISFSHAFPALKVFQKQDPVIAVDATGDLIHEAFEFLTTSRNWYQLYMREEGKVEKRYVKNDQDQSRCLLIQSLSEKDWSYQNGQLINVREGDVFHFKGKVKVNGKNNNAGVGIILYNLQGQVKDWHYAHQSWKPTQGWISVAKDFVIPSGIDHIRLRLLGHGVGEAQFDDIILSREHIDEGKVDRNGIMH